jgi:hypothetical protein
MRAAKLLLTFFYVVHNVRQATAVPWDEWHLDFPYIRADTVRSPTSDDVVLSVIILAIGTNTTLSGVNSVSVRNITFPFTRIGNFRKGKEIHIDPMNGQAIQIFPGEQMQISIIMANQGADSNGNALANLVDGAAGAVATIVGTAIGVPAIGTVTNLITSAITGYLKGGCDGVVFAQTFDVSLHDIAIMNGDQNIQRPLESSGGDHNTGSSDCNPSGQKYSCGAILQRVATADEVASTTMQATSSTVSSAVSTTTAVATPSSSSVASPSSTTSGSSSVASPSSTTSSSSSVASPYPLQHATGGPSVGLIVGAVVGGVVALVLLLLLTWFYCCNGLLVCRKAIRYNV